MYKTVQLETVPSILVAQRIWSTVWSNRYLQWPCIVLSILLLHYLVLHLRYQQSRKRTGSLRLPPTVPYVFPVIGSAFAYLWDPWSFVPGATYYDGKQTVSGVKFMGRDIYLLQGRENIQAVWKSASLSAATFIQSYALDAFFGMPAKAVAMYEKDDAGLSAKPNPGSAVEPHNRINYKTHHLLDGMLSGAGLVSLLDRFQTDLIAMIHRLRIQDDWTEMPDLFLLLQQNLTPCIIENLCGSKILVENPDFVATFWQFEYWLPTLSRKIPRMFARQAYASRDKLLKAVKRWHAVARQGFKHEDESLEFEPFWGCKGVRQRQAMFSSVDDFGDDDAMASADLGMIWAANSNAVPATFWMIYEVFRDPELLARVRNEVLDCIDTTSTGEKLDINKLLKQPLLQSIYTEVLRLRTHLFIARGSNCANATIGEWLFPLGRPVLINTTPSHLDPESWYKGPNETHPVNTFWADRFLVGSGKDVKFSMERSEGMWFPYGGGSRICPGRHFSKRGIVMTVAQFALSFDINIRTAGKDPNIRPGDFAMGVIGPANPVPFEIRRRRKEMEKST